MPSLMNQMRGYANNRGRAVSLRPVAPSPAVAGQPSAQPAPQMTPAPTQDVRTMLDRFGNAGRWYQQMGQSAANPTMKNALGDYYVKNFSGYLQGNAPPNLGEQQQRFQNAGRYYKTQMAGGANQQALDNYYQQNFANYMKTGQFTPFGG